MAVSWLGKARNAGAAVLLLVLTACQAPVSSPPQPTSSPLIPSSTATHLPQLTLTPTQPKPTALPLTSTATPVSSTDTLKAKLDPILAHGGEWHVILRDQDGSVVYEKSSDALIHPASVIKVAIGMLTFSWLEENYADLDKALETGPIGAGRSYGQLLQAMLVFSEEDAAQALQDDLVKNMGWKAIDGRLEQWGASHTALSPRRSTARDISELFIDLYRRQLPTPGTSARILAYLSQVTKGDTVRLWKLNGLLPDGSHIYNKRGSLTDPMIVADAGIIVLPDGHAYYLMLFGYPSGSATFEDLDKTISDFALAWYTLIRSSQ
jgi:hypothetical protein